MAPEQPDPIDMLSLLAMCIAVAVTGLIIFVIIAGVISGELNPTAVATMLGGVLTTILGVLFTTTVRKGKGKNDESE